MNWNLTKLDKITKNSSFYRAINSRDWQRTRVSCLNTSLLQKHILLRDFLKRHKNNQSSQIAVLNYINALKRGGLIT